MWIQKYVCNVHFSKLLNGCKFVLEGFEKQRGKEKEIVVQIEAWGGSIENKVAKSTTALIIADKGKQFIFPILQRTIQIASDNDNRCRVSVQKLIGG